MTEAESRQWRSAGADQADTNRRVHPDSGEVLDVRIGPLGEDRWGLAAEVFPPWSPSADPIARAVVSCATEQHARALGDELLNHGPDRERVSQLAEAAAERSARQAAAASNLTEEPTARLDRTRQAIREHWRPELADRVLRSLQFGALAQRLYQLEQRGIALPDVLGRLDQDALLGPKVRDAARLAEWMCENLLTVVDTGPTARARQPASSPEPSSRRTESPAAEPEAPRRPSPVPRPRSTTSATPVPDPIPAERAEEEVTRTLRANADGEIEVVPGPPPAAPTLSAHGQRDRALQVDRDGTTQIAERAWREATAQATVWPALRATLGEPAAFKLRANSDSYTKLVDDLAAKQSCGWQLEAVLANPPTARILDAHDPAGYLLSVVNRRAKQTAPTTTRTNEHAMKLLVGKAFPIKLANQIIQDRTWPTLASSLAHVQATARPGDPSAVELLRGLSKRHIAGATYKAAYANHLLVNGLPAHRKPTPRSGTARPANGRTLDPNSAIDQVTLGEPHAPRMAPERSADPYDHAGEQFLGLAADATRQAAADHLEAQEMTGPQSDVEQSHSRAEATLAAAATAAGATHLDVAAALRARLTFTPPAAALSEPSKRTPGRAAPPVRTKDSAPRSDRKRTR